MPRDASGNYTLPASNPVITGTVIESNWANTTMPDLGNEITDSLSRNGEGGMLAPLKNVNGTALLPAWTFNNDVQSGMYLNAPSEIYLSVATVPMMRWTATGVEAWNVSTSTWGDVGNMFSGPNPTLANTDAAIIIGTKDPTAGVYIAMGPTAIQCKSGPSTAIPIGINTLGGDVELGQFSGTDLVYAYGDQFIVDNTPTSGGTLRTFSTDANEYGDGLSAVTAERYISTTADAVQVTKQRSNFLAGDINDRNMRIYNSSIQNVDGTIDEGDTLSLNPLGGDVYLGAQLNVGDVRFFKDANFCGQTILPSQGGLSVNNTLTGTGEERVLTLSDLSTPQFDVVIDGDNPTLANATCALTTGTDDPSTFSHLAYGVNLIQAKMNGTTADTLFLNNLGGDVRIGSSSFASTFYVSGYSTTILQTVSPASGGVFVNNTDTGAGLERVLTTSDLYAPAVATFVPIGQSLLVDTFARPSLNLGVITPSTVVTVGPTGSGADQIWTALDSIPLAATAIKLRASINVATGSGAALCSISLSCAPTAAGTLTGVTYTVAAASMYQHTSELGRSDDVNDFEILLDGSNIFKAQVSVQNQTSWGATLVLQGYSQ